MTLERAVLEMDADVDGDGSRETGVFHMVQELNVTHAGQTGYSVGGRGSAINSILKELLSDGDPARRGFFLDLGGGRHTFTFRFLLKADAKDENGNDIQWGNSGDPAVGPNKATATGADPLTQAQVMMQYWRVGEYDSRAERARLRFGEYSDATYASGSGLYDNYLHVTVEKPQFDFDSERSDRATGSVTVTETQRWDNLAADVQDKLDF